MDSDWTRTNELRYVSKPYITHFVLQQKWTRKVMHEETDPTSIYYGMCLTETEEEWRDIPIVEEA
jgi:hypothetical protein